MRRPSASTLASGLDARDATDLRPSKSQKKRDMVALQKLGETLVEQPPERVERLGLPEALAQAIAEARRIRDHEGRRRQMQYIGRLMRDADDAPIRDAIDAWEGTSRAQTAALHAVERWRDRLVEDDDALTDFAGEHTAALNPDTLQKLRTMVRAVRKEKSEGKAPRHYRALFRLVRDAMAVDVAATPEISA